MRMVTIVESFISWSITFINLLLHLRFNQPSFKAALRQDPSIFHAYGNGEYLGRYCSVCLGHQNWVCFGEADVVTLHDIIINVVTQQFSLFH